MGVDADGIFEGHLDIVSGFDVFRNQLGFVTCSLDKTVRNWDFRTKGSEVLITISESLPWDLKVMNGDKELVVGMDSGEIGVVSI